MTRTFFSPIPPTLQCLVFFILAFIASDSWHPAHGGERALLPPPLVESLPNGLEIAWFIDPKLPLMDVGIFMRSGSIDDPEGKSGTAELLSASLFRGADGVGHEQFVRASERLGASRYASASDEDIAVGYHGLSRDAPELLSLLAKAVLRPDLPNAEVEEQKARILDRWRHVADYGDMLSSLVFSRRLTGGTPYGRGGFASLKEFGKLSRGDLVAFHKEHFQPQNAILVIAGRVDRKKLLPIILREFGEPAWSKGLAAAARKNMRINYSDPRIFRKNVESVFLVDRPNLAQASVHLGFRAPLLSSPDHYPLLVLNALLGEHFNSRLNLLLRDKLGLTYSVQSALSFQREISVFSISSNTRNESAAQLITETLAVLNDLKNGGISASEVQTAKEFLIGSFSIATDSPSAAVSRWLTGRVFDMGEGYLNGYVPGIRAVTPEQVLEAARTHLDVKNTVITVTGKKAVLEPGLKRLKMGPVRKLTLQEVL